MAKDNRKYHEMRLDQDGREYRCYKNVLWGKHYNPETGAHHCRAMNADAALKTLKPGEAKGFQTLQVYSSGRWQWVTDVPEHLGGISKQSHGERA